ncbi:carbohydrate ABC transporter permease [Alkalicoccus halolimnae]|jgi:raffinose/stachyose/melibiose transport system permease protein|uniref:Carbohydrate ABC transporter permease n=1 Tax=Alkalicoccus halolimnae TaxID=1667239 RepID=A0A5C7FHH6_9BACI|nr:carbohydrate ABC transporter permease [Alkalicoccus halolimnae]TXF84637.1 carbohydrate ABC transporter permease [Alkalicoccus halolimnae]
MENKNKRLKLILTGLALFITLLHAIPFYILITTALKTRGDFSSRWALPDYFTLENFAIAWEQANLGSAMINSFLITAGAAVILILFGSMAAYPLARKNTKLNKAVLILFVAIMVVPPLTALVPLYQLVVDIGLLNTRTIAVLVNAAAFMPLTIFLYSGFIRSTIPKELEEAARIDGANTLGIFFKIVFPLLKPVTASVLIVACVFIWNDYQFAIFFLQSSDVHTLTVTMDSYFTENQHNLGLVAAAAFIAMLPMAIMFLMLQKYFIAGLASGAVKG